MSTVIIRRPTLNAMDTWALFRVLFLRGSWGDLASEDVMDIRRTGNRNCTNYLLHFYPKINKVISVSQFPTFYPEHFKIDYQMMDIENRYNVEPEWANSVSKVVSSNYFHYCDDQAEAFRNLFYILKPGGEAALLFNIESGHYEWFLELSTHQRWREYYDGASIFIPESHHERYRADYYERLFKDVGFTVLYIEDELMYYSYSSDKSCKESAVKYLPFSYNVPEEFKEEFKEESFEIFLKHNGRNSLGEPWLIYRSIIVLLKKPLLTV